MTLNAGAIILAFIASIALLYGILDGIGADVVQPDERQHRWFIFVGAGVTAVGVSPDALTFSRRYIVLFTGEPDSGRLTPGCRVQ
ncbi:hypothetical protein EXT70_17345 [Dickeya dadantii]|nr:hypothetical protein [Dickeya dadantii]